jgi:hypothetical protein
VRHGAPLLLAAWLAAGCARSTTTAQRAAAAPSTPSPRTIALPGAPPGGVFLDYLAYDPAHDRVWVPAGGTGRVDGFATKEVERYGQKRLVGPSSATIGDGVVYVGNRGDSTVCAIDAAKLVRGDCATLDESPDGLAWVSSTKEVWVTTPRDESIRILDVSTPGHPVAKARIPFEGEPEGFAVDDARGAFFTNLEDLDRTLVVDLRSHAVLKTFASNCGKGGPKGLAFDAPADHLVVVCPDRLETLDVARDGAIVGTLAAGDGLDAIDLLPSRRLVVAAAARAEKVTFATLAADGSLAAAATVPTAKGARNAVLTSDGTAFVADGPASSILVVAAPKGT